MKLAFFDSYRLGVVLDGEVVDVSDAVADFASKSPQQVLRTVIEGWHDGYQASLQSRAEAGRPLEKVRFLPPIPEPTNIDCVAINYHENELSGERHINAFLKSPSAIIGDGDTMVLPDVPAKIFETEAELGLIIGKRATNISAAAALDHVFGYINFIDGSARGLLPTGNTFYQMKSRDTFCPIGPYIVTADEIGDPQNLDVKLWNNGELMQDFNTSKMVSSIPECLEFLSSVHTLEPGNLVSTGTDHRGLHPLMDGDRVEMEIAGLGRLHLSIRDDLKRTWKRETRRARVEQGYERTDTTPQLTGKYASAG